MKQFISFIFLVLLVSSISAQTNLIRVVDEYCPCFKLFDKTEIKNCISTKDSLNKFDLSVSLEDPSDQIWFISLLADNCIESVEYFTKKLYQNENLSDREYTERVYEMLSYFKDIASKEPPIRAITISPLETGLIYNIYLNKVQPDTLLESGTHFIQHHDSIITFRTGVQELNISTYCKTKKDRTLDIEVSLHYNLKKNNLFDLWNIIGTNYENMLLLPEVKSAIIANCSELASIKNVTGSSEESEQLLKTLKKELKTHDYFDFIGIKIRKIQKE